MLGKTNQLDALLGQIGWALDNSSDNQDESTAEIEVDAIKNLDLEPNEHDQGGTQAITETNLMSAIDQQSSSKVTFSELVQERSISFVGSKPASPNANGHEDLHLELYHLDFKDADQISGSEKSDDDIYQLSNEMLEYQDPTAMDEDEQIQAGLGDVLTYDAPEPNQPEESEDDLFITQEPDSQLAKNLANVEDQMDKKSSCTSNEQSGPRIARTSVAGSATNSNRATPTNKNRDPFIDPDATGESFLHSETKAIGIRDQKPVKSTFYQLYGHMYRITNLASHQENPFPTDGGSGIDPLLDTFEQSAVIMLNTGRKEESQETKQSAGDTLPIEAVASTAAEDIMFGTDNILQGIITQDIEDEHDLSNDSMFSSKSIHDDDSLLGESHSATPSAQLTTPHNNRTLPSMSVEMTPGTFFAELGSVLSAEERPMWFTPKGDKFGRTIASIADTPAVRVRPPLYERPVAQDPKSKNVAHVDASTSPIPVTISPVKIALTQQDSGFENGKDVGCGMKSESQLWFDDIMKISLSEKPHMRSIPLSPKAADYHLDIPPKVVLKRNGRFATAAKQSIKIQFAESNDRHRRKVTILISNTTNADATWKLIPIGKAYLEREQKKLPLTDEIFKFSILTGRVTSGEQFFCSLSFTPLMPGRFMQTWHLRVNNHTIPVYIDAIIIVNRKPSRILRPSSAHPYIDPTLNIERTKAEPRELPISNLAVSGKNDIEMVDRREMLMRIISDTAPAVPIYDNLAELPKAAIPGWIEMKDVHIPKQPRKKALSSLNFGAVRLFESKTISFKIANPSTNTAQVELTVTGPFRLPAMYVSIRARSFITIPIKYTPETLGGTHDRLLVLKDSQLERVDLIGCGI